MKTSSRTVLVLSRQFVSDIWPCVSDMKALSDTARRRDRAIIVVLTETSCDVPRCLLDLSAFVDVCRHYDHWWSTLACLITASHNGITTLQDDQRQHLPHSVGKHYIGQPTGSLSASLKTRGQSNLTKSASQGAHSPVKGHPRGSKVVPLNSWGRVSC